MTVNAKVNRFSFDRLLQKRIRPVKSLPPLAAPELLSGRSDRCVFPQRGKQPLIPIIKTHTAEHLHRLR